MSTVIHSSRLIDDGRVADDAWVFFDHGRVRATGTGQQWQVLAPDDVVDAAALAGAGALLSPGFVDIHGHGGGGAAYDDGVEAIRAARALHRAHGTTSAVVSLATAPLDELVRRVSAIAAVSRTDPDVLGSHLEGPFLDPAHRGAHDPAALIPPGADALARLLAAGRGTVRQVTLAPDLPGGIDAIGTALAAGAAAAVGHTGADAALAARAFAAGASILTHAFNAMSGLHHREPGPVGAAIADGTVTLEVIADGVHLHPTVVRLLFAAAPGRIALVTDAMAGAGAQDGAYRLGGLEVEVVRGVARLTDGTIAGSTLTQDVALRTAVSAGVDVVEALRALTVVPARAVGASDKVGTFVTGSRADAVVLDERLHVRGVWAGGRRAH